ncbi:LacI family transcriptional regulator [Brevibacterium sp. 91QC2O2]|uniref:substrate-binding domain-containing protein n=1 Tax=Brevibacterium sp. 91QC2O2 TaxID=2968458 RepID=UPI00211B836F|nr:LacI family DNA-binding transcriptional regulator [Brevibacterium sp. 91QC2O2]MCQ9369065.1 LacI family transcriptional regulator [Brevibacterium sp. 91QC2O2]
MSPAQTNPSQGAGGGGPRAGRPTLAAIGAASGLSPATVSRVLRGLPGPSERARRAVHVALGALGVAEGAPAAATGPGPVALVQRRPLAAEVDAYEQLQQELVRTLSVAGRIALQVYIGTDLPWRPGMLREAGATGAILIGDAVPPEYALQVRELGIPTVRIGSAGEEGDTEQAGTPSAGAIALDRAAGVATAVGHLIQLGHTRIGLAVPEAPGSATLVGAFRRELAAGLHIMASRDQAPVTRAQPILLAGTRAADELLGGGVSAIISCAPALSFGVLEAARRRGLRVPEHVSVVTVGEMPEAAVLDPPMTQLAFPWSIIAESAVRELSATTHTRPLVVIPDLVLRRSEAPLRRR